MAVIPSLTPAEWNNADFAADYGAKAAYRVDVVNAFVRAVNERLAACYSNAEAAAWWGTNKNDPAIDPSAPITGPRASVLGDPYVTNAYPAPMTATGIGSEATRLSSRWRQLQDIVWRMRLVFVPQGQRFDVTGKIPQSIASAGVPFPKAGLSHFTRKYPREIASLSAPGEEGQKARLVIPRPAFLAGPQSFRDLACRIFEFSEGAWNLLDDPSEQPDELTGSGFIQPGDFVGPWILDELRSAIKMFVEVCGGTEFGEGGSESDGLPNKQINEVQQYQLWNGSGYSSALVALGYLRHNLNPLLRMPVSGEGFLEGNFTGDGLEPTEDQNGWVSGDAWRKEGSIHLSLKTMGDYGVTSEQVFSTLWQNVNSFGNKTKRIGSVTFKTSGGTPEGTEYTYTNYSPIEHAWAPFDPRGAVTAAAGVYDSYGGLHCVFSITNTGSDPSLNYMGSTAVGGHIAKSVLQSTRLIPYGLKANVTQYIKAEKPDDPDEPTYTEPAYYDDDDIPRNEDGTVWEGPELTDPNWDVYTTTLFNAFGSGLNEGQYTEMGYKAGMEWDLDMSDPIRCEPVYQGKMTMEDTLIGPLSENTAPDFGSPPFVPVEPRTEIRGYRVAHILRFYNFANAQGFKYY